MICTPTIFEHLQTITSLPTNPHISSGSMTPVPTSSIPLEKLPYKPSWPSSPMQQQLRRFEQRRLSCDRQSPSHHDLRAPFMFESPWPEIENRRALEMRADTTSS